MSDMGQWNPRSLNGPRLARSLIITDACAANVAGWLPQAPTRDEVRQWLRARLAAGGYVTSITPPWRPQLKSPSDYFATVEDMFVLALRRDRQGTNRPVAVDVRFAPDWLRCYGRPGALPDPFTLRGRVLVDRVEFSGHCLERFQTRCDGDPEREKAAKQLRAAIEATAQAVKTPPPWVRYLEPTEFFLVAGNYCLPMAMPGRAKAFEALTCLYRPRRESGSDPTVMVRCSGCGHVNKVLRARVQEEPRCANSKCGRPMRIRNPRGM